MRLNFRDSWCVELEGRSGGLALWWNRNVSIQVISSLSNWIDVLIQQELEWHATFIYGNPVEQYHNVFLQRVKELVIPECPWLLIGDFNICNWNRDKWGWRPINRALADAYDNFLFDLSLTEINFCGNLFTWSNMQSGQARVMKRIYKAICNTEWALDFPNTKLLHGPFKGSDHRPLVLLLNGISSKHRSSFKFDMRWAKYSSCEEIIKHSWAHNNQPLGNFFEKLDVCKHSLLEWSRNSIRNSVKRIKELSRTLEILQSSPFLSVS